MSNTDQVKDIIQRLMEQHQLDVNLEGIQGDEDLSAYGIHSLHYVRLIVELEQTLGLELEDTALDYGRYNTLNRIASLVEEAVNRQGEYS